MLSNSAAVSGILEHAARLKKKFCHTCGSRPIRNRERYSSVSLQSSIADAELSEQSQAAASADREALQSLQTQLAHLQAAQSAAETRFAAEIANQQTRHAAWEGEQSTQLTALQQDVAAVKTANALYVQQLPEQLQSLRNQLQQEQLQQLRPLQDYMAQLPQQLLELRHQLTGEQAQLQDSLHRQMQEQQLQQQVQHESASLQQLMAIDALKLEVQQLQQWRQQQLQQESDSSKTGVEVDTQPAADLVALKEEVSQLQQQLVQQRGDADVRLAKADQQAASLRQDLQHLQEQQRLQSNAHTAALAKTGNDVQQLTKSLAAEFTQRLESALATQVNNTAGHMAEVQRSITAAVLDSVTYRWMLS